MTRRHVLLLLAPLLLSGCIPASGELVYDLSSPDSAVLSVTLTPDLRGTLASRPRSVEDFRSVDSLVAAVVDRVALDPLLCAPLGTFGEVSVVAAAGSIACTVALPASASPFTPDLDVPVATLWAMRETVGSALASVLQEGYEQVPDPSQLTLRSDLASYREGCVSGSLEDCMLLYDSSEPGSSDEMVALLALRDDLVGDVPSWVGSVPPIGVEVRVAHPGTLVEHNGQVGAAGVVVWEFVAEAAGESQRGIRAVWEAVEEPEERESSGRARELAVYALLGGALLLFLLAARKLLPKLKDAAFKPAVRKVKQRSLSNGRKSR